MHLVTRCSTSSATFILQYPPSPTISQNTQHIPISTDIQRAQLDAPTFILQYPSSSTFNQNNEATLNNVGSTMLPCPSEMTTTFTPPVQEPNLNLTTYLEAGPFAENSNVTYTSTFPSNAVINSSQIDANDAPCNVSLYNVTEGEAEELEGDQTADTMIIAYAASNVGEELTINVDEAVGECQGQVNASINAEVLGGDQTADTMIIAYASNVGEEPVDVEAKSYDESQEQVYASINTEVLGDDQTGDTMIVTYASNVAEEPVIGAGMNTRVLEGDHTEEPVISVSDVDGQSYDESQEQVYASISTEVFEGEQAADTMIFAYATSNVAEEPVVNVEEPVGETQMNASINTEVLGGGQTAYTMIFAYATSNVAEEPVINVDEADGESYGDSQGQENASINVELLGGDQAADTMVFTYASNVAEEPAMNVDEAYGESQGQVNASISTEVLRGDQTGDTMIFAYATSNVAEEPVIGVADSEIYDENQGIVNATINTEVLDGEQAADTMIFAYATSNVAEESVIDEAYGESVADVDAEGYGENQGQANASINTEVFGGDQTGDTMLITYEASNVAEEPVADGENCGESQRQVNASISDQTNDTMFITYASLNNMTSCEPLVNTEVFGGDLSAATMIITYAPSDVAIEPVISDAVGYGESQEQVNASRNTEVLGVDQTGDTMLITYAPSEVAAEPVIIVADGESYGEGQGQVNGSISDTISEVVTLNEEDRSSDEENSGLYSDNESINIEDVFLSKRLKKNKGKKSGAAKNSIPKPSFKLKCDFCSNLFSLQSDLLCHVMKFHKKTDTSGEGFKCEFCGKTFGDHFSLKSHTKVHRLKPNKCKFCEKTITSSFTYLTSHRCEHTVSRPLDDFIEATLYGCITPGHNVNNISNCAKFPRKTCTFAQGTVASHTAKNSNEDQRKEPKFIRCDNASETVAISSGLNVVFDDEGSVEEEDILTATNATAKDSFIERDLVGEVTKEIELNAGSTAFNENNFECDFCKQTFNNKPTVEAHVLMHLTGKAYQCKVCKKTFKTNAFLKTHMRKHAWQTTFECMACNKSFSEMKYVRQHVLQNPQCIQKRCTICNIYFKTMAEYTAHCKTHFVCEVCKQSFTHSQALLKHKLLHEVKKTKLQCKLCGKMYSNKTTLQGHFRFMHEDRDPYVCGICSKVFRCRKSYKNHLNVHNNVTFPCKLCSKVYHDKRVLSAHMKKHSVKAP